MRNATYVRIYTIKKQEQTKDKQWRGCGTLGTLVQCWWKCKTVQPLCKAAWQLLKKLKIDPPWDEQSHVCIFIQQNENQDLKVTVLFLRSRQCYSQWLRLGNNLHVHGQMSGPRKYGTYTPSEVQKKIDATSMSPGSRDQ